MLATVGKRTFEGHCKMGTIRVSVETVGLKKEGVRANVGKAGANMGAIFAQISTVFSIIKTDNSGLFRVCTVDSTMVDTVIFQPNIRVMEYK